MGLDCDTADDWGIDLALRTQPAAADPKVYSAGDRPGPGVYREVERGIIVRLQADGPLPDLNSHQPSRFYRLTRAPRLPRGLVRHVQAPDLSVLYKAREHVPAGIYQDLERGVLVRLVSDGPLPDLQTHTPSRYHCLRRRKLPVPRPTE